MHFTFFLIFPYIDNNLFILLTYSMIQQSISESACLSSMEPSSNSIMYSTHAITVQDWTGSNRKRCFRRSITIGWAIHWLNGDWPIKPPSRSSQLVSKTFFLLKQGTSYLANWRTGIGWDVSERNSEVIINCYGSQ